MEAEILSWLGLVLSYVVVFGLLGLSTILKTRFKLSEYLTRKIVHIGVSNWWFIAVLMMEDTLLASFGPITFIILNYLSYRFEIFKGMETKEKSNLGTVYFPISLLLLVLLSYSGIIPKAAAGIGILVMGYADGMAAIVGKKFGRYWFDFSPNKSLEGSLTFAVIAFGVSFVYPLVDPSIQVSFLSALLFAFLIGLSGMLIEIVTPVGLDNLSVPILTAFAVHTLALGDYRLVLAILVNFIIAAAAFRKKAVSSSGFVAGITVGTVIFLSSLVAYFMLMAFFITSSVMSKIGKSKKRAAMSVAEKGHRRDYLQVLANSIVGVITALLFALTGNSLFLIATAICFATANADTWASEVGNLSSKNPVSIMSFKRIRRGLSGGVTLLGTAASLLGSMVIATVFLVVSRDLFADNALSVFFLVTLAGFFGGVLDSLLGATIQVKYVSSQGEVFEKEPKYLDSQNYQRKGWSIISNDMVNLITSAIAVPFFSVLYLLIR